MKIRLLILCVAFMTFSVAHSQDYLGIYANPQNFTPLFADGNANNVATLSFTQNTATGTEPICGSLGVSAEYAAQTYAAIAEGATSPATTPHSGLMFGAQSNNLAKLLLSKKLAVAMNDVGTPSDIFYSPTESISDMSVVDHYGFEQYASVEELHNLDLATDQSHAMGTIVYTFTRPVDNPILHMTGLGGFFSSAETGATQLFSVDYEFVAGGGATGLTQLDGTSHTVLAGNTIQNDYTFAEYAGGGSEGVQGDDSGSGSFLVNGTNVTSVTFNVIMVGKAPQQEWTSVDGEADQKYTGDRFNSTWTLPLYEFGGKVVIDNNANGDTAPDPDPNGVPGGPYTSGAADYAPLFAVLVDDQGNVAQIVPVDPATGCFVFAGALGDTYTVLLTTDGTLAPGSTAPGAATLPTEWASTEEEFVMGGSDGDPNSVTNPFTINNTSESETDDGAGDELILGITNARSLPVELISFDASKNGEFVILNWETSAEINNDYFEVQRSTDGKNFDKIGKVIGAGTASVINRYDFMDRQPETGMNYYRLRQVDYDGAFEYSPIRTVRFDESERLDMTYFPNPVTDRLSITSTKNLENHTVRIMDLTGKLYANIDYSQGMVVQMSNYEAGIYLIQVVDKKGVVVDNKRVIRQ